MQHSAIREQFPIFQYHHPPLIYLDSAATTQKPAQVIEALTHFYTHQNANAHRGVYPLAWQASQVYEQARYKTQQYLNAAHPEEIIFTKGATESINLVAQSFLMPHLQKGDHVVVTAMEHHANLVPWQQACAQKGAVLKVVPVLEDGMLDYSVLSALLTEKVKMLACVHISNTLGTCNPIEAIIAEAHQKGIPVLIDAAQSAACLPLDVQALACDFLVFSGHKLYGPMGIGVLYGKQKWLDAMPPYQFGGGMIRTVQFENTTFNRLPHKFEAGTPNVAGAVGLMRAIQFIEEIGRASIWKHQQQLLSYATQQLAQLSEVTVLGNATEKGGIISFSVTGVHPHDVATFLGEKGIAIRAGHHCTQPLMAFYKVAATARISFGIYNMVDEIDRFIFHLKDLISFFK